ncbi:hypothetical protein IIA16_00280 [bacterium]|nr:hypothetical protein [bacterium]
MDTFPPIPEISQGVALAPFGDGGVLLVMFTARSLKSTVLGPNGASDWWTLDTASEGDQWGWICPVQGNVGGTALLYGRPLRFLEIGEGSGGEPVPLFETTYIGDWLDCAAGVSGTHVLYQEGGGGVDDGILWYGIIAEGGEWILHPVKIAEAAGNGIAVLANKDGGALLAYTTPHSNWQEDEATPRLGSLILAAVGEGEVSPPEVILESVGLDALPALGRHQGGALTLAYIDNLDDTIQILERAGPAQHWQQTELAQLEPGPIGALSWPAGPVLVDMGSGALAILFTTMTFPAGNEYARATLDLHMCTREGPPGGNAPSSSPAHSRWTATLPPLG